MKKFFKQNSRGLLFKWLSGFGRSMNRIYENRNHRVDSNGELTVIKKLSNFQPKVVVDGGANVGGYTKLLAQYFPQSTIYAFEPVGKTFQKLEANLKSWDLSNGTIQTVNQGLFSETTTKQINLYNSDTHSSLYELKGVNYASEHSVQIHLISGDAFMEQENIEHIDFLKLDLEGAEYDALKGFEKALKAGNIKCIQFEYGYINISSRKLLIDFYELLEPYGYVLGKIYPKSVEFREYEFKHEDFIGPNMLAVLKTEKEWINALSK